MALQIEIGTDNSGLERGISDVEKQLQTLERRREARVRIGADVGDLDRRITQTTANLTRLRSALNQTSTSAQNFNRQTANGSNTLTQFSRIAQDAPFGIMGIGNNLTATAEAFANLSRNAGGTRAALSAVGQSLLGGGGILLAISLVTTGLTLMSQKGLTVSDVFAKLTGTFDENRAAMQKMNVEVAKNAQGDISGMNAYIAVAKDVNLSLEDRLIAVKKLQDEYPAYFGNLTKEQILQGNVASTVKEVTAALIARAKASALTERIVKLAEEEEQIRARINNVILEAARAAKLNVAQTAILAGNFKALAENGGDFLTTIDKVGKEANLPFLVIRGTLVRVLEGFRDLGAELRNNKAQQDRLTGSLEEQTKAHIKLEAVKEKATKKANVTQQVQGIDFKINTLGFIEAAQQLERLADGTYVLENNIKSSLSRIPGYFDTSGQKALEKLQNFNKQLSQIVTSGTTNAISGIGEAIGSALVNGGNIIDAVGKSLLSTIGSLLVDLGKATIAYGVGLLAIQTAIKNPYTAIAAGAALVVVGSAISAAVNKTASGMPGGNASTGAGYSSPGSSVSYGGSGSSSGLGGGNVVFEISGQSLVGVLSNTLDKNSRLGGNLGLNN